MLGVGGVIGPFSEELGKDFGVRDNAGKGEGIFALLVWGIDNGIGRVVGKDDGFRPRNGASSFEESGVDEAGVDGPGVDVEDGMSSSGLSVSR